MNRGEYTETTSASKFQQAPTLHAIEIAGALQSTLHTIGERDYSLDVQQEEALHQLGKAIVSGKKSGYIEMATSTGKTTIESLVAEAGIKANKRVLMLAPTISIADQLSGQKRQGATGLTRFTNLHDIASVGHHYGTSRAHYSDQLVISTYNGLLNEAKRGSTQLGDFDIVIADECHRSLGEYTSAAMKTMFPDAFKFGFSATADYAIDRKSEEVFGEQLFEFSLIDAVESGKTAPVRTLLYETDQKLELYDTRNDFTERELAPLIDNPERNGTAFQLALSLVKEGRQGIIACIPGEINIHARIMAAMLNQQDGINAAEVGAHLTEEQNALRLKAFQQGAINVLTFTRTLEEGWDSDKASFCINMAPTSSPVRTKQLLGRTLRKKPNDFESIYIDFVDTKLGRDKAQYTAMHALDLETVNVDRVLGHYPKAVRERDDWHPLKKILMPHLDGQLLERIMRSNGRLLSDVLITEQAQKVDPLVRHWERILNKEGMPAEIYENDVLPPVVQKMYDDTYNRLVARDGGLEPTPEEVIEAMVETKMELSSVHKKALGRYGIKLAVDVSELTEVSAEGGSYIERLAMFSETAGNLKELLDDLSEREAEVIRRRFGIYPEEESTYEEIGEYFGVARERIRQIESKTMAKLRHPSRSVVLKGSPFEIEPEESNPIRKNTSLNSRSTELYINQITKNYEPHLFESGEKALFNAAKESIGFDDFRWRTKDFTKSLAIPEISLKMTVEGFDLFVNNRKDIIRKEVSYLQSRIESLRALPEPETTQQKEQRKSTVSYLQSRAHLLANYTSDLDKMRMSYKFYNDRMTRF